MLLTALPPAPPTPTTVILGESFFAGCIHGIHPDVNHFRESSPADECLFFILFCDSRDGLVTRKDLMFCCKAKFPEKMAPRPKTTLTQLTKTNR